METATYYLLKVMKIYVVIKAGSGEGKRRFEAKRKVLHRDVFFG